MYMKKKLLNLLPILLIPFSISACNQDKVSLTYGTLVESNIYAIKELFTSDLLSKTRDQKEVFLLAVYQDHYSTDCTCWETFLNVIATYINTTKEMVYTYNAYNQDETVSHLNIDKYESSTPTLYIFNGEKKLAKFNYANNSDRAIFEDTTAEAMKTRVHNYVDKPTLFFVDEKYMDTHISEEEEMYVTYFRRGCGDCTYVVPNVIIPYIKKHNINTPLYLFDIQDQYNAARSEFASAEEKAHYQDLKDKFGLSEKGSAAFGYQYGVVPTIQYIKKGQIIDAAVFFNDVVDKKEDGSFYIADSYYSEERLPNLKYLKGMDKNKSVLKGQTITDGVLETPKGGYYWSQEESSKYHRPLLEAFLDYYLLNH